MNKISKRASNELLKRYIKTVWKSDKGFFENLFSILTYASPFLGVGLLPLAAIMFSSHVLKIGSLSDFGKWIDSKLNLSAGETPSTSDIDRLSYILENAASKTASLDYSGFTKQAGIFSAIFKSGKLIKLIVNSIKKIIIGLSGVFAVASLDDFVKELIKPLETDKAEINDPNKYKEEIDRLEKKYKTGV